MSDRIPGSSPYNPIRYGKWNIWLNEERGFDYAHPDGRCGHAASERDAIAGIEQMMMARAMGPAQKPAPFDYHRCWKCNDGERPCVNGNPHSCEYLHARND